MNKKLAVFDFDGTLANVPPKPKEPQHGWNGHDWWGSEVSLTPPFYHGELHEEVANAFKKAKTEPNTHTIVLTGRRGVISHLVRNTLRKNGLYGKRIIPDSNPQESKRYQYLISAGKDELHPNENLPDAHHEYFCGDFFLEPNYPKSKNGKIDVSTWAHKWYVVNKLIHNKLEELEFWDDRNEHIPNWKKLGVDLLNQHSNIKNITLYRVYNYDGTPPVVEQIPIKKHMIW